MPVVEGFEYVRQNKFEINTVPGGTAVYAEIRAGILSAEPGMNEAVTQETFMDGEGYASTDVEGAQYTMKFTGKRLVGDVAQDYIMGTRFDIGAGRITDFKHTTADGKVISGPCTIANIEPPKGDSGSKADIAFEVHCNGKPTVAAAV